MLSRERGRIPPSLRGALATKQSSSSFVALDCFASARNDDVGYGRRLSTVIVPPYAQLRTRTGGSSTPRILVSIAGVSEYWIVRSSRTMTNVGVLATRCARGLQIRSPKKRGRRRPSREGAGKTGCTLHPRSHVQNADSKKRTRAYRFSGSSPAFPAQWFYSLFRALPGETRACLSPSPPRSVSFPRT